MSLVASKNPAPYHRARGHGSLASRKANLSVMFGRLGLVIEFSAIVKTLPELGS